MGEEYRRGLRTCFLELYRHNVFPLESNPAYLDYEEATTTAVIWEGLVFVSSWTGLFLFHRSVLAKYLPKWRWTRLGLVGVAGLGAAVAAHLSVYRRYTLEPLNRVTLMYEWQEREYCPDLAVHTPITERPSEVQKAKDF